MRSRVTIIAGVALAVLALGVMAATGAVGAEFATNQETPENTTTPAETPDDETTPADTPADEVAQEEAENVSVNLTEAYSEHSDVLRAAGYSTTETVTVTLNDSAAYELDANRSATAGGNQSLIVANSTIAGSDVDLAVWTDDSERYLRLVEGDNVSFARLGPPSDLSVANRTGADRGPMGPGQAGAPDQNRSMGPGMDGPMGAMQSGPAGMMAGGHATMMAAHQAVPGAALLLLDDATGEFSVTGGSVAGVAPDENDTSLRAPVTFDRFEENVSGTLSLVVSEDGVVRAASLTLGAPVYDAETTYTLTVEEVGVTELDEPAWLADASEEAGGPDELDEEPATPDIQPDGPQGPPGGV